MLPLISARKVPASRADDSDSNRASRKSSSSSSSSPNRDLPFLRGACLAWCYT